MKKLDNFRFFILFFTLLMGINSKGQQALIPQPSQAIWGENKLNLSNGAYLALGKSVGNNERKILKEILKTHSIATKRDRDLPLISLNIVPRLNGIESEEGYALDINSRGIFINALHAKGLFYALQTLAQFEVDEALFPFVSISDQPAYSIRGFLLDVGRNYQPVSLLKEQIDIMAKYKLNVLHFHFTEDVAWRLESKKYPGLTASENMTRWPGKYYTHEEFKELIDYCKDRHVLFLPEIDMPGHSAAFKRFFKVDMQSEQGIFYIKDLLQEFAESFPSLKHLHIGGDEVKINNKSFIPLITKYVDSLGLKTYGWDPGSNLEPRTVRQLWMGGPKKIDSSSLFQYIDSKHLYINHMDPLETVTTLFFRRFGEQEKQSLQLSGAILCSWPDRTVKRPEDMFLQSAIYPAILTFAERIWRGGGKPGWKVNLPNINSAELTEFIEYENRLLTHKSKYFFSLPFPYQRQSDIVWEIIGPFQNEGVLSKSFAVENENYSKDDKLYKKQVGGTIVLRHWWADIIPGLIDSPKVNSTFYARTKIWSNKNQAKLFWIGFANLSRSYASDSPDLGTWDDIHSQVFVNGQIIPPPIWENPGHKGDLEFPLIDEGYSFRKPTKIMLKKGWNTVLVKLPIGDFKGKDWQNPRKWMFTFVPYQ